MPVEIDNAKIRELLNNDRALDDSTIQAITEIIANHGYTVNMQKSECDGVAEYDLDCCHENERLNFNAYGDTVSSIADAIYWHCENGMENDEPYCLTQEEADAIMVIYKEILALLENQNDGTTN